MRGIQVTFLLTRASLGHDMMNVPYYTDMEELCGIVRKFLSGRLSRRRRHKKYIVLLK